LTGAFARGRDEYPTTLRSAIDMLDTHRFDPDFKKDCHESFNGDTKKDKSGNTTDTSFVQKNGNESIVQCPGFLLSLIQSLTGMNDVTSDSTSSSARE
jgi:hypothetical protein